MFDQWMTREAFMRMVGTNLSQFIDRETGRANFDSDLFRSYLEFARTLQTEEDLWGGGDDGFWPPIARPEPMPVVETTDAAEEYEDVDGEEAADSERVVAPSPPIGDWPGDEWISPWATGQVTLMETSLWGFRELMHIEEQFGGEVTLIGYPSEQGIGSVLVPRTILGISTTTRHEDAAWSFVRTILTERYQRENSFSFATNRNVLEGQIVEAMTPPDWWGGMMRPTPRDGDEESDFEIPEFPLPTQDQIDRTMAVINQVSQLPIWDQTVLDIITQESQPFFAGDRNIAETVRIIQSRVQLILSERG